LLLRHRERDDAVSLEEAQRRCEGRIVEFLWCVHRLQVLQQLHESGVLGYYIGAFTGN
jgi:hypothetical protein